MSAIINLLKKHLPTILPEFPDTIKGTAIIAILRERKVGAFTDQAFRYALTQMSKDKDSCCQKVKRGQGYFLRKQRVSFDERFVHNWEHLAGGMTERGRRVCDLDRSSLLALVAFKQRELEDVRSEAARHRARVLER